MMLKLADALVTKANAAMPVEGYYRFSKLLPK
jgi:hypothetical protein